ncbi:hypothetical protein AB0M28_18545 [Streptomyces sp. NPDC051940]|uniref:hypothetical protein n=1 Tax=Streptomyces sp. NPDC051940 TaxID=3155675 RepID=UPI0034442ACB
MGGVRRVVAGRRALSGAGALATVLVFLVTALAFCRVTVADPAYWTRALRAADAYDRTYDELLVDPGVRAELRSGALGVPLRNDVLIDQLPLLVPRPALQAAGDRGAVALTSYLTGRTAEPSRAELVRPLTRSAQAAGERQLAALKADAEPQTAERLGQLARDLQEVPADQWRSGGAVTALRPPLSAFVSDTWDPETAAQINGLLDPLLQVVGGATAATGAADEAKAPRTPPAPAAPPVAVASDAPAGLDALRPLLVVAGSPLASGTAVLGTAAVCALVLGMARRAGVSRTQTAAAVCGGAAVLASAAGLAAWAALPAPAQLTGGLPQSAGALVADVARQLYGEAARRWAVAVLALTSAAVALPALCRRSRRQALAAAALVAAQLVLLPAAPSAASTGCNGSTELCDRPYDEVVQIGAHNAMSTVADGFLNAHHDPSITGQLDLGVRALLLDTHYWETGETLLPPGLGLRGQARDTLVRAVDDVVSARRGTWLCHGPCRLGASGLTAQLRAVGRWLDAHPRDVVTLIVQDGITAADTERAFREAGLLRHLARPPADPTAPWPTLGTMVRRGQRLVVFAEQGDGPMPWYPNLYRYATETPYQIAEPGQLGCVPGRGGASRAKRLFLLNHFVTRERSADRLAAAAVNRPDVIVARAHECARTRGGLPTVIAVNHVQLGDAVEAARRLNAEGR